MTRRTTTATPPGPHRATGLRAAMVSGGLSAALTVALAAGFGADAASAASGGVRAKATYCMDCHGPSAQGYRGYFPIPRLAGQQPKYLENQLNAFIERRRANSIMFSVAHVLSPSMVSALAEYFHNLHPRPIGGGPRNLIAAGRKIFEDGIPDANVAACAACHGPGAVGNGEVPRLAGQLFPYIVKELTNWSKERGQNPSKPDTSLIMEPVAHSLARSQVEAVAAYLSSLD